MGFGVRCEEIYEALLSAHLDCLKLRNFHRSVKNEATVDAYVDM